MLALLKLLQSLAKTLHSDGTFTSPTLFVRSNLDRARADRPRTVAGEEVAKATAKAQLDAQKQKLDARLKSLTGGIIGLPKLPGT